MIKVIVLLKRGAMIEPSVFVTGSLKNKQNCAVDARAAHLSREFRQADRRRRDCDAVIELRFDNEDAMRCSFNSNAGGHAVADASHYCHSRCRLICEERCNSKTLICWPCGISIKTHATGQVRGDLREAA